MASIYKAAFASLGLMLFCSAARADLSISNKPTQNMSCSAGVCTATAKGANLNVSDLTNMLASGDTTVKTGGGAITIQVLDEFSWTSASRLTLDANHSIGIHQPVVVAGTGAVTITTNDGGFGGDLLFFGAGKINFLDVNSSLLINGNVYTLVSDLPTLVADINNHVSAYYALANSYDASVDGDYSRPPIDTWYATMEGLGNSFLNVSIHSSYDAVGLIATVNDGATIRDLNLSNVIVDNLSGAQEDEVGGLAGQVVDGTIIGCSVSGSVQSPLLSKYPNTGGLVGLLHEGGTIDRSHSTANVSSGSWAGGVTGLSYGIISRSYAAGSVTGKTKSEVGGLVGHNGNGGNIIDSYSTANVQADGDPREGIRLGGLLGGNRHGKVRTSYSTGTVQNIQEFGGLIGIDDAPAGHIRSAYWDLDTSGVNNPSRGAGYPSNDEGITGLTDTQLKSGLPASFDPSIWGQNPNINNGYPYLRANPPQ